MSTAAKRMHKSIARSTFIAIALVSALALPGTAWAQWLKYPTAGVPRTADGKPNLSAPTPRTADGKPDFSGIWLTNSSFCRNQDPEKLICGSELPMGREGFNMGVSLKGGLPYQPWLAALVKERTAEPGRGRSAYPLPSGHVSARLQPAPPAQVGADPWPAVMLDELNAGYRQIFTDGRPLPEDPNPSWQGYSSAKWDGDTLIVNSIGFRDDLWIDSQGSMIMSTPKSRSESGGPTTATSMSR